MKSEGKLRSMLRKLMEEDDSICRISAEIEFKTGEYGGYDSDNDLDLISIDTNIKGI